MTYRSSVLQDILRARSLTQAGLSSRLGLTPEALQDELDREPQPRTGLLKEIANELAVPEFVFFMEQTPTIGGRIPDFRSTHPKTSPLARETTESIQLASSIQNLAGSASEGRRLELPKLAPGSPHQIEVYAQEARAFFGITLDDQAKAKSAREFYVLCRQKIEKKGIFVLHESFPHEDGSGFCLANAVHPIIVVNTRMQTRGRRLFTLVHELAHVLLGMSGISDPFIRKNTTEILCNHFASNFLMPQEFVRRLLGQLSEVSEPDREAVAAAARKLKVSQEATVLRLEQLGIYRTGSYAKWKRLIQAAGNPDFAEKSGGAGGPPPQEKVKLARYGLRFAQVFEELLDSGRINEITVYRGTGLKPKFLRPYFSFARSLGEDESYRLELDDE